MNTTENIKVRARLRMNELGLDIAALAKRMGRSHSTLSSLFSNPKQSFKDWPAMADALETNVQWLTTGVGGKTPMPLTQSDLSEPSGVDQRDTDTVPVMGHANGSVEAVMLNSDSEIGRAPIHPNQFGQRDCFALYARGESMSPRYRAGELVYVVKNRQPQKGQDCVVELHSDQGFVKEFMRITTKEIICMQLYPKYEEWKRPLSEVKAIHAVVGRG